MNSIRHNLLTYINFIQNGRFSYKKVSADFLTLKIPHEDSTLRKEFSLLKKEGFISFKLHYRKPCPILSTKGKLEIKTHLAFKKYGPWDKKWRVVIFDLPERERKYRLLLVEKLTEIGFAPLSRGAYISPFSLLSVAQKMANYWGINQHLSLLTVEKINNDKNITECWNLKEINTKYTNFIKMTTRIQRHARLWPIQAKEMEQAFAEIFALDPHLPKELLPKDWQGQAAYDTFKEISNSY